MKKLRSFNDVENYLKIENVPYKDNKDEIQKKLNNMSNKKCSMSRRMVVACATLVVFVSITSIAIGITLGFIPEHDSFVASHKGKILNTIYDDENCVFQIGIVDDLENYNKRHEQSKLRDEVAKSFEDISIKLEKKLPNDKVALFIPVEGLDSFIDYQVLNDAENYNAIEDIQSNMSNNLLLPKYIPEGFDFSSSEVFYYFEDFYKPYEKEFTFIEYLNKLFDETKSQGKNYYYKEGKRTNTCRSFMIDYESKEAETPLQLVVKRGKTTIISDVNKDSLYIKDIEYNGTKYLVEDNIYYTYLNVNDELWNIEILAPSSVDNEEVFKIVESMKQ